MAHRALTNVLRYLYGRAGASDAAAATDGELLARFVNQGDESGFEMLLNRHAGLVWQTCQRLLPDAADAEDAFQATFLVLLRRARSLDGTRSLAGWLFGVARRVAQRARMQAARRRTQERQGSDMEPAAPEAIASDEIRPLLDAELAGLPDKYRAPLVLCYFQGKTNEEAARELGWPAGSIASRLARGRELLRDRLVARGMALSLAALTAALAESQAVAAPAPLVRLTLGAASASLTQAAGGFSPAAIALAEGVLRTMFLSRLRTLAVVLASAFVLVAGAGVFHHARAARAVLAPLPEVRPAQPEVLMDAKALRLPIRADRVRESKDTTYPLVSLGHFPADDFRKLPKEQPVSKTLAVLRGWVPFHELRAGTTTDLLLVGPRMNSGESLVPTLLLRRDNTFTLVVDSWTDNGGRDKNVPAHEAHLLELGDLPAGKYELRIIQRSFFHDAAKSSANYALRGQALGALLFRVPAADEPIRAREKLPRLEAKELKAIDTPEALREQLWQAPGRINEVRLKMTNTEGSVRAGTFNWQGWVTTQPPVMPELAAPTANTPLYAAVRGPTLNSGDWMELREVVWKDRHATLRVDVWRDNRPRARNVPSDPLIVVPLNAPSHTKDNIRATMPGEYQIEVEWTMLLAPGWRDPYEVKAVRKSEATFTIK